MTLNKDISDEIKGILDNNTLNDLKRFILKRQCINTANSYLIYLFHFVQSAGILTSSIAAGNNYQNLLWVGIALNFLATLIHVYEKTNNSILKKLLDDIKSIKAGTYVDESEMIDVASIGPSPGPSAKKSPNIENMNLIPNPQNSESIPITNSVVRIANSYNTFSNTDTDTDISHISNSSSGSPNNV